MFTLLYFFFNLEYVSAIINILYLLFYNMFQQVKCESLDYKHAEQEVVRSHTKHVPRKRSRAASSSRPARAGPRPVRRTRATKGNHHANIDGDVESDESGLDEHRYDQKLDTDCISKMDGNNSEKD
jgi:hypothetical protein